MTPQLNEEQLQALRAKHGDVFELKVPTDDSGENFTYAYLKSPSRAIMGAVLHQMGMNSITANETLLKNCMIAEVSDPEILTKDELFYSCSTALGGIITVRKAELKKS